MNWALRIDKYLMYSIRPERSSQKEPERYRTITHSEVMSMDGYPIYIEDEDHSIVAYVKGAEGFPNIGYTEIIALKEMSHSNAVRFSESFSNDITDHPVVVNGFCWMINSKNSENHIDIDAIIDLFVASRYSRETGLVLYAKNESDWLELTLRLK